MKSTQTKRSAAAAIIFTFISICLNIVPMGIFIVKGYMTAETVQKATLSVSIIVAVILLVINLIAKLHMRSVFWVLLIGIAICIKDTTPLFITMAITVMLDEFIFAPLARRYRERTRINKEIDKRG